MDGLKGVKKILRNQRGYNMVELITVIVVVALVAALMIPGMVGMIDEARKQADVTTARSIYIAAQAQATQNMAAATPEAPYEIPTAKDLEKYLESDGLYAGITTLTIYDAGRDGTIDAISFKKDGNTIRLDAGDQVRINGKDQPLTTVEGHLNQ
ncbi:MAG: prepilin-type N-terminal cleavage/methylation domain-containing protein [Eubacterium aggregans]|uniref:Prepilin-type N-terminal cleavage/methylation domain-containing protein n=1 Tax=Eubacterium aggregans TaxID=81409 RepID=A0A1H4AHB2_9FIRM|nr:prepilin-type N-terminal cleavage/methylation domain-containing protein [Eubacterium aggregans]MEA5072553.1 prepilin-type N-terminal cleavage/methylation domain-containing protein [Eubacterium aggregans]SEA34994.1 prepilin-type N-terminal cleavage/methylation domain-containing protein [Eubacterium aggregans]